MAAHKVTVRVPATSANLGPGFDCLGLALELSGVISLEALSGSRSPNKGLERLVIEAAERVYLRAGKAAPGFSVQYDGAVPLARGLGASAVLRVAGVLAANTLLGEPLSRQELLAEASALERHADNAAPALLGGLQVVVSSGDGITSVGIKPPPGLRAVLFVPEFQMPTQKSRQVLPASLSREDAVHNIGRAALLVAAMSAGRFDLLGVATQDRLHQPARASLFPAMTAIFEAAQAAGAHCAYLSGSGSTICALASSHEEAIAAAMAETAIAHEVYGKALITAPSERGAEVVTID